jgi:hypothetical protein
MQEAEQVEAELPPETSTSPSPGERIGTPIDVPAENNEVGETKVKTEHKDISDKKDSPFVHSSFTFPQKLFHLLGCDKFTDIVRWRDHGLAFQIHDENAFMREVAPFYFRREFFDASRYYKVLIFSLSSFFSENKWPSFQRQLNLYGFRKTAHGSDSGCYYHPHFQKQNYSKIFQIRRMADKAGLASYDEISAKISKPASIQQPADSEAARQKEVASSQTAPTYSHPNNLYGFFPPPYYPPQYYPSYLSHQGYPTGTVYQNPAMSYPSLPNNSFPFYYPAPAHYPQVPHYTAPPAADVAPTQLPEPSLSVQSTATGEDSAHTDARCLPPVQTHQPLLPHAYWGEGAGVGGAYNHNQNHPNHHLPPYSSQRRIDVDLHAVSVFYEPREDEM